MGYLKIEDDLLWAKKIEGDNELRDRIKMLPAGATIRPPTRSSSG